MRTPRLFVPRAAVLAVALAGTSPAFAQEVNPPPASQTASPSPSGDIVTMDPFAVAATTGQSYGASNLASASRLNTPIQNIPETINVVNANLLKDEFADSFDEAMRYVPGVTQRVNNADGAIIRGLSASAFDHYEDGYFAPRLEADMGDIDRIEVIKGPSASIAGAAESTGLINYITKKPLFTDQDSIFTSIGSWGNFRTVLDSTGPIPVAGYDNLAYRVVGTYLSSDSYRYGEHTKKASIYPSFLWKIDPATTLFVKCDFVDNIYPSDYGEGYLAPVVGDTTTPLVVPANAVLKPGHWLPMQYNSGGWAGLQREDTESAFFAGITHSFNDWLTVRQSMNYYSYTDDNFRAATTDTFTYDTNGNLFNTDEITHDIAATPVSWRFQGDLAVTKEFLANTISIRALVGYELYRDRTSQLNYESTNTKIPIEVNAPDYTEDVLSSLKETENEIAKGGEFSDYLNGQVGFWQDRVILTGGFRRDQNKASWTYNLVTNASSSAATTPFINSPLGGITVKPLPWVAVYAVYSNAGAASTIVKMYPGLSTTDPQQVLLNEVPDTINKEFGGKFTFFGGDLNVSVSHFDTWQSGITVVNTNPNAPGGDGINSVTNGNNVKGIELDWAGNLTRQLSIFGGYINEETFAPGSKPYGGSLELRGVPREKVNMFVRYEVGRTRKGSTFAVFGGVVRQTAVWGYTTDSYIIPGAMRADLGFNVGHGNWSFSSGVINVSNAIFPEYAVGQGSNTVDAPRNFYFSAQYKF